LLHQTLSLVDFPAVRATPAPAPGRLAAWLARKSRDRLVSDARALLARHAPAGAGDVLSLDCLRGTGDGRLARLRGAASASADTIVSVGALADAPDAAALLAEVKRVLRPGGRLLFAEPVSAPAGSRQRRVQRALGRVWQALAGTFSAPRDLWNDLKAARFDQLHFQDATLAGFGGVPVPYIVGQAVAAATATAATAAVRRAPAPVPRRPGVGAATLTWREPAFAFFGN
ncbi:MAG TPA: methyltransferase domain-containing protein, partial [Polyangia bacterium]|nr:methyltransferase domain-containing protein [Polyangia bacterium]